MKNFNTTIVQLKGIKMKLIIETGEHFNTTIVQLKAGQRRNNTIFFKYFNTTIVQLKDRTDTLMPRHNHISILL